MVQILRLDPAGRFPRGGRDWSGRDVFAAGRVTTPIMMRTKAWLFAAAVLIAACGGGTKKTASVGGGSGAGSGPGPGSAPPAVPVAQGHPKADLIPRSVLFGNPDRSSLQISPDGRYYSWLAPKDGVLNLFVAPASDITKARAMSAEKSRPVRNYGWAADGHHLYFVQDQAGDENFHTFLVDVSHDNDPPADIHAVAGARVEVVAASEKHPGQLIFTANDRKPELFDYWTYDLATGTKTLLAQNDGFAGISIDRDYHVRFGTKPMPDGSMVMQAWDAKKQTWTDHDVIPAEDALTTGQVGWSKDGTSYYLSDSRGRDTAALYAVDARTKKKTLILEDARADVGAPFLHPTTGKVEAVMVDYDRPRWVVLDKAVKKDFAAIAKLDDGVPMITGTTLDFKTWLITFTTDHQSPSVWRWDHVKHKGERLFSIWPSLDDAGLAPMYPQIIKSRDGLDLVSYLTLPNDADEDQDGHADHPVPTVMWIHGGPWGRDSWGYDTVHQTLANRGYAVISVNYRGSTGFGKKFTNAGDLQWGKKMHDDVLDVRQWALDEGIALPGKICIAGASYGGYETLVGVAMTPDAFACGVDLVGPSNLVTFQDTIPAYWGPFIPMLRAKVGDPTTAEGKKLLIEASPLTHVGAIKVPLLIGQGKNDPRVNIRESDQIVKAMQAKKIPVSYVVFPDEGHGFARAENNVAFFAIMEAFLSVHLGGYFQPISFSELDASSMQIVAGKQWLPGLPAGN